MKSTKPKDVGEYIAAAPKEARSMLKEFRKIIKSAAPKAVEKISYGMPYYDYHGRLVYFAAFKNHCSMFVMSEAREAHKKELAPYAVTKATLHFEFGKKLPVALLKKVVKTQARANETRANTKKLRQ